MQGSRKLRRRYVRVRRAQGKSVGREFGFYWFKDPRSRYDTVYRGKKGRI